MSSTKLVTDGLILDLVANGTSQGPYNSKFSVGSLDET